MNLKTFKIFIILCCILLEFGLVEKLSAQSAKKTNTDSSVTATQEEKEYLRLLEAVDQHRTLLEKYPNSEFAGTVMFQLAELYARLARADFNHCMANYEKELELYDKGQLSTEPQMPKINYRETIELCYRLLKEYPRADYRDRVIYQLAMAQLEEGNYDKAKEYFYTLINDFDKSDMALEAHFRLGEYFFEVRDFTSCTRHFSHLVGKWDSPFFDMALYKLGWAYYNTYDYINAITTFIYLIEDIDLLEELNSQIMGKTKADLRTESIAYIASCFTEIGGAIKAREFLEPYKDKDYVLEIFIGMGSLYQKRNSYNEAIETFEIVLDMYPFYEYAPELYVKIIENYELDQRIEEANRTREAMAAKFGPGSAWLVQYSEGEPKRKALELAEKALYELGTYFQAEAQNNKTTTDYQKAIDNYRQFLDRFPDGLKSCSVNYYLAECLFEIKDYEAAAEAYYSTATLYDSCSHVEDAAYNRVLCYYELLAGDVKTDTTTIYLDEFLGTDEVKQIKVSNPIQANLVRALNDFAKKLPDSKFAPEVLMKFGQILHQLGSYLAAVDVYKRVLQYGRVTPFYLQAATSAAQSYFDAGLYRESDIWFRKIAELFPDSTQVVETARKMTASALYKIAEKNREQNDYTSAAAKFMNVAETTRDKQIKERSFYEAAVTYFQASDTSKAATTFERLAREFPESELADEALYKAAGLRESTKLWELAAMDYMELAEKFPTSEYANGAVLNAAICYENAENWTGAESAYRRYASVFAKNPDEEIESNFKMGEMAFKGGNIERSKEQFDRTIKLHTKYRAEDKAVDEYFAAQAQFLLGEIYFLQYKVINLVPPMESSLKLKQKHLNLVLKAFTTTLEYKVADWTTAASYRIGNAFEEFARFFKEAPSPENLTPEALREYNQKLDSTYIFPLNQKALEAYTGNVKQAEANNIQNMWVNSSRERMEALSVLLNSSAKTLKKPGVNSDIETEQAPEPANSAPTGSETGLKDINTSKENSKLVYKQGKKDGN